jgi:hypothetical protein
VVFIVSIVDDITLMTEAAGVFQTTTIFILAAVRTSYSPELKLLALRSGKMEFWVHLAHHVEAETVHTA